MVPHSAETVLKLLTKPAGLLNKGLLNVMALMDPQGLCNFEVIFLPRKSFKKYALAIIKDQAIATFNVDAITANFSAFDYERLGNLSYLVGITHPEEISITFLETELGACRFWLDDWIGDIINISDDNRIRFNDNQNSFKKDCIIIPQIKMGLPSPVGIKLNGLKIKAIESIEFSQNNPEIMKITATFSVDSSWFRVLTELF